MVRRRVRGETSSLPTWHSPYSDPTRSGCFGNHIERSYGLSLEDFRAMMERQNGECAMCHRKRPLVIDHNHDTGIVRALLCVKCNTVLGYFEKNRKLVERYLEEFPE